MRTIRRRRPAADDAPQVVRSIRFGAFVFDLEGERLVRHGEPLHLTTDEASLLKAFAEQAGRTLSREQLIEASRIEGNPRTVAVQVTRLRPKVEADTGPPRWLQTVWGRGHVFRPDRDEG